jgi:phosphoserine phosphatase
MKRSELQIPILDLLIIDIDDTFIYHRTVAIANKLFLEEISGKSLDRFYTTAKALFLSPFLLRKINKRVFMLLFTALRLYVLNAIRTINNKFFNIISCEKMIDIWAKTVIKLGIRKERYYLSKDLIEKNLKKCMVSAYKDIKNKDTKVLAITESFNIEKDPIKDILDIDELVSNRFVVKDGIITDCKINVKSKEDKLDIARKYINKKAKNVGLIIEDYDDLDLLNLKNIRFVLYKKHLKKWIKPGYVSVKF